jgi:hypothetical protein
MSNDLDIFQQGSTAVATQGKRVDAFTSKISGNSVTSKSISIRNNRFRLMVNGKELDASSSDHLDIVIINSSDVQRMYYKEGYKAGQKSPPPACWTSNAQTPDETVPEPQSTSCMTCPQNAKGSGANGSKACRFHQFIAVVRADQLDGDVYRVKLPSQSMFGTGNSERRPVREYAEYVKANGEVLSSVVSRMTFDPDASATRVGFRAIKQLNDDEFAIVSRKSTSEEAIRAITLSVNLSRDEDTGEEFEQKPKPAVAVVVDSIPEPTVRAAAPKPAAPPAPVAPVKIDVGDVSLDDLVADWES